ncbi:EamA family transporter [Cyanobium sp. ATX 6A2]|uniref:EamA family transporter n=1 Tax=Cyanobium sp. ATX 6A2 TaxID=2823700 RepID=UPI0020CD910A|nr:EamA family transporter [Cyanobium sp. ATX 6A2]MCP9886463.1 EamA family transporter [Cyanobium sp. ATX 6A2]
MNQPRGLADGLRLPAVALPLGLYVLLRGLDAPVLKRLQELGLQHQVNGENPISFCNVFFFAQLVVGVAALLGGRRQVGPALAALTTPQRWLLATDTLLGRFLAPVAYFTALQSLSVISQTLLFALVLPLSALLARALLAEPLPRAFLPSLVLISAGLLLPQLAATTSPGPMDDPSGLVWALLAVLAFSAAALTGRRIAAAGIPPVLSVGVGSLVSALVFAVLAVILYGPGHFLLLRLWWVVGVILIYALSLSLGSELALRHAYRHAGVATVSLWGSLTIAVAVLAAALLLGEPLDAATVAGVLLLLAGVGLARRRPLPFPGGRGDHL